MLSPLLDDQAICCRPDWVRASPLTRILTVQWDMGDDSQLMKEGAGSGNLWPPAEDLPDFRPTLQHAWDEIMALGKRLLPIFSLALGLDEHYFDEKTRNPGSVMRILHYPPQFGPVDLREIGIGAHTCVASLRSSSNCR